MRKRSLFYKIFGSVLTLVLTWFVTLSLFQVNAASDTVVYETKQIEFSETIEGAIDNVISTTFDDTSDIVVKYAITKNSGINSMTLILNYDANVFQLKDNDESNIIVNSSVFGENFTATVTGSEVDTLGVYKVTLEGLTDSESSSRAITEENVYFLTVTYQIKSGLDVTVGGEYNFGFNALSRAYVIENSPEATENDPKYPASQIEVPINVVKNTQFFIRKDATIAIHGESISKIYDAEAFELTAGIHYDVLYGETSVTENLGEITITWYTEDSIALGTAPINVGSYKVKVSIGQSNVYNSCERSFNVKILKYELDLTVDVNHASSSKEYTGNDITWLINEFSVTTHNLTAKMLEAISNNTSEAFTITSINNSTYQEVGEHVVDITVTAGANFKFVVQSLDSATKTYPVTVYIAIGANNWTVALVGGTKYFDNVAYNPTVTSTLGTPIIEVSSNNGLTWTALTSNSVLNSGTYLLRAYVLETDDYHGLNTDKTETVTYTINKITPIFGENDLNYSIDGKVTWNNPTKILEDILEHNVGDAKDNFPTTITFNYTVDTQAVAINEVNANKNGFYTIVLNPSDSVNYNPVTVMTKESYKISFAEGTHELEDTLVVIIEDQYRFENQFVTKPTDPTGLTGYMFNKWFLQNSEYEFTTQVTNEMILTATWTVNKYFITWQWNKDETSAVVSIQVEVEYNTTPIFTITEDNHYYIYTLLVSTGTGENLVVNRVPKRVDSTEQVLYTFAYWTYDLDGTATQLTDAYKVTKSVTFTARFYEAPNTFVLTVIVLDGTDGTAISNRLVTIIFDGTEGHGSKVIVGKSFAADEDGFTAYVAKDYSWFRFLGWFTNPECTETIAQMPRKDQVIYGRYFFDIGAGDVNANGLVNADDILLYRQYIVGGYEMNIVEKGNEWSTVYSETFNSENHYFLVRTAEVAADDSEDIRDVSAIRMAIVTGYGYFIKTGLQEAKVTGEAVTFNTPANYARYALNGYYATNQAPDGSYDVEPAINRNTNKRLVWNIELEVSDPMVRAAIGSDRSKVKITIGNTLQADDANNVSVQFWTHSATYASQVKDSISISLPSIESYPIGYIPSGHTEVYEGFEANQRVTIVIDPDGSGTNYYPMTFVFNLK